MRILVWAPEWDNRWLPYFKNELSRYETTFTEETNVEELKAVSQDKDLFISMWGEGIINLWGTEYPDRPIIVYLRRYEAFLPHFFTGVLWDHVSAMIFVNDRIRKLFTSLPIRQPKKTYLIYNAIDLNEWKLKETIQQKPTEIALACKFTYIKNIPFAMQILSVLPKEYRVHHIGYIDHRQKMEFTFYGSNIGVMDRFLWNDRVPANQMQFWYSDKDFILSTSVNEGNPNNVLEGMACGLKPVVHNWPGAKDQFPESCVFNTAEEAARIIQDGGYCPQEYRTWVEEHYSLKNIARIHEVIRDCTS